MTTAANFRGCRARRGFGARRAQLIASLRELELDREHLIITVVAAGFTSEAQALRRQELDGAIEQHVRELQEGCFPAAPDRLPSTNV